MTFTLAYFIHILEKIFIFDTRCGIIIKICKTLSKINKFI